MRVSQAIDEACSAGSGLKIMTLNVTYLDCRCARQLQLILVEEVLNRLLPVGKRPIVFRKRHRGELAGSMHICKISARQASQGLASRKVGEDKALDMQSSIAAARMQHQSRGSASVDFGNRATSVLRPDGTL